MTAYRQLDGGVATELQRAGLEVAGPWWTNAALLTEEKRRVLRGVHTAFLAAGSDIVTANTFRCNLRSLRGLGLDAAGFGWMVHAAVGVAMAARKEAGSPGTLVAGSMAPVEDCYRPDLVPPVEELAAEHGWLAEQFRETGVDLVLIETMNTIREARVALDQVLTGGGRAWVSFVCGPDGRLLSGEPVAVAGQAVADDGAEAVLVNCTPLVDTEVCLRELREGCDVPLGAYPNLEDRRGLPPGRHVDRALPASAGPDEFADTLQRWRDELGVAVLGGCCGTTPEHLAALAGRRAPAGAPAS